MIFVVNLTEEREVMCKLKMNFSCMQKYQFSHDLISVCVQKSPYMEVQLLSVQSF